MTTLDKIIPINTSNSAIRDEVETILRDVASQMSQPHSCAQNYNWVVAQIESKDPSVIPSKCNPKLYNKDSMKIATQALLRRGWYAWRHSDHNDQMSIQITARDICPHHWYAKVELTKETEIIPETKADSDLQTMSFRCTECGSLNVNTRAWVNPNKGNEYISDIDDYDGSWCDACCNTVNVAPHDIFMANYVNYWWVNSNIATHLSEIAGLSEKDFNTHDDFVSACDEAWDAMPDEEKIGIWNKLKNQNHEQI